MKTITRRLINLENRMGLVETEETRRLCKQLEAARHRMAEYWKSEGIPEPPPDDDGVVRSVEENLLRGRQRAYEANRAKAIASELATDNE